MSTSVAICSLICSAFLVVVLAIWEPSILSDDNGFLRQFVNHEFLNVLGVILAITLASTAQLHLKFNEIEERMKQRGFVRARAKVRQAAFALIWLFLVGVLVVVIKPLLATATWSQSLLNGSALLILLWYLLILFSITQAIFAIGPEIKDD